MAVVFNEEEGIMTITGAIQHRRGAEAELMESDYIPEAGEIVIATDTGRIKAGDGTHTWANLPAYDETEIVNNLTTAVAGKALDAVQGKALNDRLTVIEEGLTGIDCGEITASAPWNKPKRIYCYGYRIDKNNSDPATRVEYLYDAVGKNPAHMDFTTGEFDYGDWANEWFVKDNKPLMLRSNGTVDYYLNPNDYTLKEDGTPSDVANTSYDGNAMAQIPLIWIKRYEDENYLYELISNIQYDTDFKAYAHTRADGSIADYFYWSLFTGSQPSSYTKKIRSFSGITPCRAIISNGKFSSITPDVQRNGSNWDIHTWSQRECIRTLLILMGKSIDTQAVFGTGNCPQNAGKSAICITGTLKDKGQFFGYSTNNQQVKVFHIEALWGDMWKVTQGLLSYRGQIYARMTPEGAGYERAGDYSISYTNYSLTSGWTTNTGQIKKCSCSEYGILPTIEYHDSSVTTYYPDYIYNDDTYGTNVKRLICGGCASFNSEVCGVSTMFFCYNTSDVQIGVGLSCIMPAT